jgi:hypothetical protein
MHCNVERLHADCSQGQLSQSLRIMDVGKEYFEALSQSCCFKRAAGGICRRTNDRVSIHYDL